MEMFELGGLKDQGETIDRKSRNKVPVGSLQKEVRDDVPINISEGEFVFPADVVRYHGLEKIMNMRQDAKSGLKLMDKMGQMGNSDQATLPDDIPFRPQNYQEGGAIVNPQIQMPQVQQQNQVPGVNVNQPQQLGMRPSVYSVNQIQPVKVTTPSAPTYTTMGAPQYQTPTSSAATPDYSKLVGAGFGQLPKSETKRYFNKETGEEMFIPFIDGKPIYPIPAGFVEEAKAKEEEKAKDPTKARVDTTRVVDSSDDSQKEPDTKEFKVASTLSKQKGTGITDALGKIFKAGPIGIITSKLAPTTKTPSFDKPSGLFDEEIDQVSNQKDVLALQAGYKSYADLANSIGVSNPKFEFGTTAGTISRDTGKFFDNTGGSADWDTGTVSYQSFQDFIDNMKASTKSGWHGGTGYSKQDYNKMNKTQQNNYINHLNILGKDTSHLTDDDKKEDTKIGSETIKKSKPDTKFETGPERFDKSKPKSIGLEKIDPGDIRETKTKKSPTVDQFAIDPTKKTQSLRNYFKSLKEPTIGKPTPLSPLQKFTEAQSKSLRKLQQRAIERKISEDVRDTGRSPTTEIPTYVGTKEYQDAMSVFDTQDTDSPDTGGPGSTDIGFSTAQGGFIPRRKKRKQMKQGGLASR